MYCPQCGIESPSGLQYCRSCGANLKVIGKALTLSEAIARSDRGLLPKIKEMVKNLKVDQVTEEVSRAFDRMNNEIVRQAPEAKTGPWWRRQKKTAQERRENHLTKGTVSLFSGMGLTVFLYYFTAALVLRLPPDVIDKIPFEIEPLLRVFWLVGLVPMLSGAGHIVAGLLIRPGSIDDAQNLSSADNFRPLANGSPSSSEGPGPHQRPASVTERTTNLLERAREDQR